MRASSAGSAGDAGDSQDDGQDASAAECSPWFPVGRAPRTVAEKESAKLRGYACKSWWPVEVKAQMHGLGLQRQAAELSYMVEESARLFNVTPQSLFSATSIEEGSVTAAKLGYSVRARTPDEMAILALGLPLPSFGQTCMTLRGPPPPLPPMPRNTAAERIEKKRPPRDEHPDSTAPLIDVAPPRSKKRPPQPYIAVSGSVLKHGQAAVEQSEAAGKTDGKAAAEAPAASSGSASAERAQVPVFNIGDPKHAVAPVTPPKSPAVPAPTWKSVPRPSSSMCAEPRAAPYKKQKPSARQDYSDVPSCLRLPRPKTRPPEHPKAKPA